MMATRTRAPRDYGPIQMATRLGLQQWQTERALAAGLIAPPGDNGRWPAGAVDDAERRIDEIITKVGAVPDVGAGRAAEYLSTRFGIDVHSDALLELDRAGLIPCTGWYKEWPLYDGRALEAFDDRDALVEALIVGRLMQADEAATYMRIRPSDIAHLIAANWLEPVKHVRSGWQRRKDTPNVALYRAGDLDVLLHHPAIDWDAVRATPAGRPSPLAQLTAKPPRRAATADQPPPGSVTDDPPS